MYHWYLSPKTATLFPQVVTYVIVFKLSHFRLYWNTSVKSSGCSRHPVMSSQSAFKVFSMGNRRSLFNTISPLRTFKDFRESLSNNRKTGICDIRNKI